MSPIELREQYERGLYRLKSIAQDLMGKNPEGSMQIQFNFPRNVALACELKKALDLHLVTGNKNGRIFLERIVKAEPNATVLMLKIALEIIKKEVQDPSGS